MTFGNLETVTVITAGTTTDRYGNTEPDWDNATEREEKCLVGGPATLLSGEPLMDARTPLDSDLTLIFQGRDPGILHTDRVRVRGVVYEVNGRPFVQMWGSKPGVAGTTVGLKVREG